MYFPMEEYKDRIERTRAEMVKHDLPLLLIHGQEAICWLSGFYTPSHFTYHALALPADGAPKLVIRFVEAEVCEEMSWIEDPFLHYDGEDPLQATRRAVEALGLATERIGIEHASWFLTLERFEALRKALPDAAFVKEPGIIDRLRAVKSPRELDALREAGRIAVAGMQAAIDAVRAGASEREIAAEMAAAQIRAGCDMPIAAVLNTGPRTVQMHGPWTDRTMAEGDLFYFELSGIRHNYWARMLRTGVFGEPSAEQQRIAATMIAAQDAAIRLLRSGTDAREVDAACREPMIAAGIRPRETYVNRTGYGMGLNFRPSAAEMTWDFTPRSDFRLQAGMVFHMILTGKGIGNSDTLIVTEGEPENITPLARQLYVK